MTTPNSQVGHEFQRLLEGLQHWGTIDSISRLTGIPEESVRSVMEALEVSSISEEICRNAHVDEFLHGLRLRVQNARANFVWEAIAEIGSCGPPKGKGPNYERIYKDAQRDAQDALEKKFT